MDIFIGTLIVLGIFALAGLVIFGLIALIEWLIYDAPTWAATTFAVVFFVGLALLVSVVVHVGAAAGGH